MDLFAVPSSAVAGLAVAPPAAAAAHFAAKLGCETDCSDVFRELEADQGAPEIVVVDTRSAAAYAEAHVPGAVHLPHADITAETVAALIPPGALAVTYCWGPHCNAATKGALRLAELGIAVKEMLGGIDGWRREGYAVASGAS